MQVGLYEPWDFFVLHILIFSSVNTTTNQFIVQTRPKITKLPYFIHTHMYTHHLFLLFLGLCVYSLTPLTGIFISQLCKHYTTSWSTSPHTMSLWIKLILSSHYIRKNTCITFLSAERLFKCFNASYIFTSSSSSSAVDTTSISKQLIPTITNKYK